MFMGARMTGTSEEEWLAQPHNHRLSKDSDDYPDLLSRLSDSPDQLYVSGNVDALHLPAIAIVGSRNPTRGGVQNAFEFARYLGRCGFVIVSGLAQGIDTAAHKGALAANAPTVALLGHGIDKVYPASNKALSEDIVGNGALVSEFPLGSPPRREHFPQRNRLISGLSLGTLVIEAAKRSGSLITARLAGEQGREVFAIPGSIHNPLARGCHELIRQGARLVESADDILNELAPLVSHVMQNQAAIEPTKTESARDADYRSLLNALGHDPASVDQLAEKSGLTIDQVSSMLLILELEGEIESLHGGRFSIIVKR
jgi:DNA processing protein